MGWREWRGREKLACGEEGFFFTWGGWNNNKALSGPSEILSIKDFTWQLLVLMF